LHERHYRDLGGDSHGEAEHRQDRAELVRAHGVDGETEIICDANPGYSIVGGTSTRRPARSRHYGFETLENCVAGGGASGLVAGRIRRPMIGAASSMVEARWVADCVIRFDA
jgi:hypothetical protein